MLLQIRKAIPASSRRPRPPAAAAPPPAAAAPPHLATANPLSLSSSFPLRSLIHRSRVPRVVAGQLADGAPKGARPHGIEQRDQSRIVLQIRAVAQVVI